MDEQLTGGYSEPCGQCAAVDWGVSDEGQFFCRSCHNVIEKTREVEDVTTLHSINSRISQITKPKKKRDEGGREWIICEGFQFILNHQAKALVSLGVCMKFETEVLWNFWKIYLQNTQQAFTKNPVYTPRFTVFMKSQSDEEVNSPSQQSNHTEVASDMSEEMSVSGYSSEVQSSVLSKGSSDVGAYPKTKGGKERNKFMSMPRTLALCYLALLWIREAITLADLLRLVSEGRIPYVNIHEAFPEEMRLFGKDVRFFNVRYIPSYSLVHKEAVALAQIMKLPSFPTISQDCLLHPLPLTVRYLLEANLPDDLHIWVHKVIRQASMGDSSFLTFDPSKEKPHLVCYDIQAVAVIIVALKLLFKLDDHEEWKLSEEAGKKKKRVFKLKKWFDVVQPVLEKARKREEQEEARRKWGTTKPFITTLKRKCLTLKKRRVAEHLEQKFQKFTDSAPEESSSLNSHTSFRFSWGNEEGSDGPSIFNNRLDCTFKKDGIKYLSNRKYWHLNLKACPPNKCGDHFSEMEPRLPRMYVWVLDLFSFILGVSQTEVHKEVLNVERCFLKRNYEPKVQWTFASCKKKKKTVEKKTHVNEEHINDGE
ncbi:TATA box-binding -associated factor RNA polymerase I subunit B [Labeo rohita]|uniref:TATA box-binding protein-associated factor RNA polymerase I subunit B n=1 Tax=Labeo rohita TaxID=84645 RepID=A0A498MH89_LABRO|nr:TATA box-binding -associated factor RNA polymerase I subunit B [Labeo rohita]